MTLRLGIAMVALASVGATDGAPAWWQRVSEALGLRSAQADAAAPIEIFDPGGKATEWIAGLGLTVRPWDGIERAALLVIGEDALAGADPMPGDIEKFVAVGGKVLILPQDPIGLAEFVGLHPSPQPCLRCGPGDPEQAVARGLPSDALGGWSSPMAKAPIRLPDRGGWRSLLDAIGQPGHTILMEADYGWGRITICAIDFENSATRPPAMDLAQRVIAHAGRATQLAAPVWRDDREANRRLFHPSPPDAAGGEGFYRKAGAAP